MAWKTTPLHLCNNFFCQSGCKSFPVTNKSENFLQYSRNGNTFFFFKISSSNFAENVEICECLSKKDFFVTSSPSNRMASFISSRCSWRSWTISWKYAQDFINDFYFQKIYCSFLPHQSTFFWVYARFWLLDLLLANIRCSRLSNNDDLGLSNIAEIWKLINQCEKVNTKPKLLVTFCLRCPMKPCTGFYRANLVFFDLIPLLGCPEIHLYEIHKLHLFLFGWVFWAVMKRIKSFEYIFVVHFRKWNSR